MSGSQLATLEQTEQVLREVMLALEGVFPGSEIVLLQTARTDRGRGRVNYVSNATGAQSLAMLAEIQARLEGRPAAPARVQ